jgi:uncharacterized protein YbaR (Trm112 family)
MSLIICPNCEQHTELYEGTGTGNTPFVCPRCGHEFTIDNDLNMIVEE